MHPAILLIVFGLLVDAVLAGVILGTGAAGGAGGGRPETTAFEGAFDRPDGLVTNEFAYRHRQDPGAAVSPLWWVTSGSLFARDEHGWTGAPDGVSPGPHSRKGTDSAVFRVVTRRADFADVDVSFRLRNLGLTHTDRTPEQAYDGVHVFLRYASEYHLYAVTVNRRDDQVVIKKKVPGGDANGGTYYTLASAAHDWPVDRWQQVSASAVTGADGDVTITLSVDGRRLLSATDRGTGGPPITAPGRVGIRGDNDEFYFDDFRVTHAR